MADAAASVDVASLVAAPSEPSAPSGPPAPPVAATTSTGGGKDAGGGAAADQDDELEELLVHIRGIKFDNPTYGVKKVHAEINKLGGKYAKVSVKRIKKHMKKLGLTNAQLEADNQKAGVLKFYTVGGTGAADGTAAAEEAATKDTAEDSNSSWPVIPLDVPCDRSRANPHQAVMSFNHEKGGSAHGSQGEIFKIQVAQDMPFGTPMLLYNESKSKKTFIHENSKGYADIQRLICKTGTTGKLAAAGGMKAFFWGRHHRSVGRKFICINVVDLAPTQPW